MKRNWGHAVQTFMQATRAGPGAFKLLDETINIPANAVKLWRHHRQSIWLLLATAALDAASTTAFMSTVGVSPEQNPLVRICAQWLGVVVGPLIGKSGQLFAVAMLAIIAPRLARLVLALVILLNLMAFMVNMRVFILSL